MHHVRQNDLPFVGSSHQFVGADQGDVNVPYFCSTRCPATVPDRTAIPTMKSSSYGKDVGTGSWTVPISTPAPYSCAFARRLSSGGDEGRGARVSPPDAVARPQRHDERLS